MDAFDCIPISVRVAALEERERERPQKGGITEPPFSHLQYFASRNHPQSGKVLSSLQFLHPLIFRSVTSASATSFIILLSLHLSHVTKREKEHWLN